MRSCKSTIFCADIRWVMCWLLVPVPGWRWWRGGRRLLNLIQWRSRPLHVNQVQDGGCAGPEMGNSHRRRDCRNRAGETRQCEYITSLNCISLNCICLPGELSIQLSAFVFTCWPWQEHCENKHCPLRGHLPPLNIPLHSRIRHSALGAPLHPRIPHCAYEASKWHLWITHCTFGAAWQPWGCSGFRPPCLRNTGRRDESPSHVAH